MTNTTTYSQLIGMLKRLSDNSELELGLDHNASGYTVYLKDKGGVKDVIAFSPSKGEMYRQLLCACRVIETMHQKRQKEEYASPTLLDNR